jgi:hypothetical protein
MKKGVLKSFINFIRDFFTLLEASEPKKPLAVWSSTLLLYAVKTNIRKR